MNNVYGIEEGGVYYDISRSAKAAKREATIRGKSEIYCRWSCGYDVTLVFVKVDGKWHKHIARMGAIS